MPGPSTASVHSLGPHPPPRPCPVSLELKISLLVLLAAFLHACWNALVKAGQDPLLTVTLVSGVAMLVSAALLPFVPVQ